MQPVGNKEPNQQFQAYGKDKQNDQGEKLCSTRQIQGKTPWDSSRESSALRDRLQQGEGYLETANSRVKKDRNQSEVSSEQQRSKYIKRQKKRAPSSRNVQEELEQRERLLESKKQVSRRQRKEHGIDFSRIARDPRRSRGKTFAEKV